MKVRLVIMTENDKHHDMSTVSEEAKKLTERRAAVAWERILNTLASLDEKITVESCEIVEG